MSEIIPNQSSFSAEVLKMKKKKIFGKQALLKNSFYVSY